MSERVWISWEQHRRSKELASAFDCEYVVFDYDQYPAAIRYLFCSLLTIKLLFGGSYQTVFVQSPSLVLASLAALLKPLRNFRLVIDAHNVAIENLNSPSWLVRRLARYSTSRANFVIISNQGLCQSVELFSGTPLILPDKLPKIARHEMPERFQKNGLPVVVCISTFADDEPIEEFLNAAVSVEHPFSLLVTGRRSKASGLLHFENESIVFTDFIPDEEFDALIQNADLLVDLTTRDNCLVCGAYEAVSVGVPALLSDSEALRLTFPNGTLFAANSAAAYREALGQFFADSDRFRQQMCEMKPVFERSWQAQFSLVENKLKALKIRD